MSYLLAHSFLFLHPIAVLHRAILHILCLHSRLLTYFLLCGLPSALVLIVWTDLVALA